MYRVNNKRCTGTSDENHCASNKTTDLFEQINCFSSRTNNNHIKDNYLVNMNMVKHVKALKSAMALLFSIGISEKVKK